MTARHSGSSTAFLAILYLFLFSISCEKPSLIGMGVQPGNDQLGASFTDTCKVLSYTLLEDSIRTDEPILSLVGSVVDPVFGYSAASTYTEFSLPANDVGFGSSFNPDSLVLFLSYAGHYAETPTPQTLKVYQLVDELHADSAYYSNDTFDYNPTELASTSISPADEDTIIRIKFDNTVFTSNDSSFLDNAALQAFLKGFYITSDTSENGGILYLDMLSSNTKLTLYYNDTLSYDFLIDSESGRFTSFKHVYTSTSIDDQLSDTLLGDSKLYVQPMSGVKVKLQFPHLDNWKNDLNVVINKAEIVLDVFDDGTLDTYPPPEYLFIMGAGEISAITDQYQGASYFGGDYNATEKRYTFNIARHVHEILYEGLSNDGLYLIVPNNLLLSGSVVSSNRVVLGGPGNSQIPLKLNITYTEL